MNEFNFKYQIITHCEVDKCKAVEELKKQLDQLKVENEELKEDYATAKSMYDLCQSDFMELAKIKDKYKQTLTEIKEIVKNGCYDDCGMPLDELSIILQKISECEGSDAD